MNSKALVVGIALAMASPLAAASDTGFYGAVDVGQSKVKDFCNLSNANLASIGVTSLACDDKDTSYRLSLGYKINNNFSVEGGYLDAGKISGTMAGTYLATPYTGRIVSEDTEFQFAVIGSIPVADNFSFFGKIGMARWDVTTSVSATVASATAAGSASDTGTDLLWGIGAKYDLNKSIALRGQFESHKAGNDATTGRGDVEMLSMGLVFKF
jgi:OOP family OmpA-OmpF porin